MNRSDGLAVKMIKEMGIPQIIISTESSRIVRQRAKKLGIEVLCGVIDKKKALVEYCKGQRLKIERTVFIGNDINDLEAMKIVGISMCPRDAHRRIKMIAKIILSSCGGEGVVRELLDRIRR